MSVIAREAERCRGLVRDMLSFSREGRVAAGELVLNEAVAGVMSIVEAQAKTKDIRVVTRFGGEERLTGDKNQLQQVVINLCGNAVDALPRGGRLEIAIGRRARAGGEDIVLTVADNGPGIPAELREKIFEPFFTTKEDGKGTGLGLSLVRDIVERHRGRIELDSQLGRGTTFTLAFPCARGRGAADAGAEAPPAPEERGARI
jgi:signal transduction histidine kinase